MWFNSYRLSRPPLTNDPYDPDANWEVPGFRSRAADACLALGLIIGSIVALTGVGTDELAGRAALGVGLFLAGAGLGQLGFFLPEVVAAWRSGKRTGILFLAMVGACGVALLAWGATRLTAP